MWHHSLVQINWHVSCDLYPCMMPRDMPVDLHNSSMPQEAPQVTCTMVLCHLGWPSWHCTTEPLVASYLGAGHLKCLVCVVLPCTMVHGPWNVSCHSACPLGSLMGLCYGAGAVSAYHVMTQHCAEGGGLFTLGKEHMAGWGSSLHCRTGNSGFKTPLGKREKPAWHSL